MQAGRAVFLIGLSGAAGWSWIACAEPVTPATQAQVEDSLSQVFIRPDTAIWRFDDQKPYLGASRVVCGWVNYQNAGHKYVGFHQFYAIVKGQAVTLSQIADPTTDLSGRLADKLTVLCGKG